LKLLNKQRLRRRKVRERIRKRVVRKTPKAKKKKYL